MRIVVTGAFSYSGRQMAERLLQAGHEVVTLTNKPRPGEGPLERVRAGPLCFDEPDRLASFMQGSHALINTYWVRFDHAWFTHAEAVRNTRTLFEAARKAGVRRVVHVSITNPDATSELPYFRGKAEVEAALMNSGLSYCILRPTVLFGGADVLVNNIAWGLRRMPVFGVFGDGGYRLQPIHVEDLAQEATAQVESVEDTVVQATGPETFTYLELVRLIRDQLGLRRRILRLPPAWVYAGCRLLGWYQRDVVITREEIRGLMAERLFVPGPSLGTTRLSGWVRDNRGTLGRSYRSELARRRPPAALREVPKSSETHRGAGCAALGGD